MADVFLFLGGGLLVAAILYDFLRTTISMSGLGPVTAAITYGLWRAARCGPSLCSAGAFDRR